MVVFAAAFATTVEVSQHPLANVAWRSAVVVGGVAAALVARRRNGTNPVLLAMIVVAALRMAVIDTRDLAFSVHEATWSQAISDAIAGPAILGALLLMVRIRRGRLGWREVLDGTSVFFAAGLVAWLAVANPAWDDGVPLGLACLAALGLPIAFLYVTFTIELLLDGLLHNRAMWALLAATTINLGASVARAGIVPGAHAGSQMMLVVAAYALAFLLGCVTLAHPQAPAIVRRHDDQTVHPRREVVRLIPFSFALALVGYLGAVIPPTSPTDEKVQAAFVVAIIIAVLARLHSALSSSFRAQLALEQRLHTDDLTGLPNRTKLVQIVGDELEDHWGSSSRPTLVHVSVDRFKQLNDALGHATANRLLIGIADRLRQLADSTDARVARSGGDEFMIVALTTAESGDAMHLVDRVVSDLARPFSIDGTPIFVTASIGVAAAPNSRVLGAEELVQQANIATHRAKAAGRNQVVFFDESMQSHLAHRLDVEHALHGALDRRELLLYHQPIVDMNDGRLTGFEALIRWRRADGTLVSPAEFIPIAEETGIINEIGAWAIREALTHLRTWIEQGVVSARTTMSVNVSPRQITDPRFADTVATAIELTGVAPHQLWLEMTESMMLQEPELALTTLRRVRAMGVRLALDDFGTGYSSLSMLQRFPIQRIKIDRAFVHGLAERSNDRSLVRTIIAMARSMGLDLVAEGVETVHQLRTLRELGCDRAQGFLISRPVPVEAIAATAAAIADLESLDLLGDAEPERSVPASPVTALAPSPATRPIGGLAMAPLH